MDYLLTLEVVPVGVVSEDELGTKFDPCVDPIKHVVQSVGKSKSPGLDKIRELEPDLILGEAKKHLPFYKELEGIAPTIIVKDLSVDWKKILFFLADILDKREMAEQKLADFEQNLTSLKEKYFSFFGNQTILMVNVWKTEGFQVYHYDSHLGKLIYEHLGMKKAQELFIESKYFGHKFMFPHRLEQLSQLDPDYLWIFNTTGEKAQRILGDMTKRQEFQDLSCVKKKQVLYLGSLKDGNEGKSVPHYSRILNEICKQMEAKA